MMPEIEFLKQALPNAHTVYLIAAIDEIKLYLTEPKALEFARTHLDLNDGVAHLNLLDHQLYFVLVPNDTYSQEEGLEYLRKKGYDISKNLAYYKAKAVQLVTTSGDTKPLIALAEGLALSNYQFLKYKSDKTSKSLHSITITGPGLSAKHAEDLYTVIEAVFKARDLVNEPVIYLTAEQLSHEIGDLADQYGFSLEVLEKKDIQAYKMGGLLAVNEGSPNPPTFNILEYKHAKAANTHPIVLIGKGVVYDTGGLSLKPTPGSMDSMKCDMAGAAAVIGTFMAVAKAQLPIHLVGLIPATENRPDGNAITPGDVITMMSGKTVEVLNTDAEGRLILADALHFAERYEPSLIIDLATLTGAAARAIGKEGIVFMGTADADTKAQLIEAGMQTCERLVEFPLWREYEDYMKSDIADLKNIGPAEAGATTAGIFLKHFTTYPWLHLDIAGPAFKEGGEWNYRGKGGTGIGVRLLSEFLNEFVG
jgi:leucyl aminopeptidase